MSSDEVLATNLLYRIAISDFLVNGVSHSDWDADDTEYKRSIHGFRVAEPIYDVDSDFTMAYSLNGYYRVSDLFAICGIDVRDVNKRNAFLCDHKDLIVLPDPRKSRTASNAFGVDYKIARQLLCMINCDGDFDRVIDIYDKMEEKQR